MISAANLSYSFIKLLNLTMYRRSRKKYIERGTERARYLLTYFRAGEWRFFGKG